jgi:hypothetical protein
VEISFGRTRESQGAVGGHNTPASRPRRRHFRSREVTMLSPRALMEGAPRGAFNNRGVMDGAGSQRAIGKTAAYVFTCTNPVQAQRGRRVVVRTGQTQQHVCSSSTRGAPVRILTIADAADGKTVYQGRVGGVFSASPVAGDGKVYLLSETGETIVLRAGPEAQIIARNQIGERPLASMAISNGRIFIRAPTRTCSALGAQPPEPGGRAAAIVAMVGLLNVSLDTREDPVPGAGPSPRTPPRHSGPRLAARYLLPETRLGRTRAPSFSSRST